MKPKILIVDDEVDICDMMSFTFQNYGYDSYVGYDTDEALQLVQKHDFDLVLSDIRMPKGGGIRLLEEIKRRGSAKPKVFLMTGYSDSPVDEALAKGAEEVFAKPMKIKEIVDKLSKSISFQPKK
jgi:two-component system, NtrC family, response regulator HydG